MLRRIARGTVFAAAAFGAVVGSGLLNEPASVVLAQDAGALGSVKDGLREYKKGNYEKAIRLFDDALAQKPTNDDAKKIRDEIGSELALDFINNNLADPGLAGRYSRFGKWVNSGRTGDYKGRKKDFDAIVKHVDAFMGDSDIARNMIRAASIRDVYGDFAIPYLQANYMHSDNADHRYRSRVLLENIGAQGVHALIQCFYSAEVYDRQTAALALGDIADPRSLPILAKHFQDKGEDAQVKEACGNAIQNIRGRLPSVDKNVNNAKDLFFLQSEAIYRNNAAGRYFRNRLVGGTYAGNLPVVMTSPNRSYTVWKWVGSEDGGQLQWQEVPLWAYADILAEESAIQAIELGVANAKGDANKNAWVQDAEALLSCVRFHMQAEARARYYYNADDDEERNAIVGMLGEHGIIPQMHGFGLAASIGSGRLYNALERALADGYPSVAIDICRALGELGDTQMAMSSTGSQLLRALGDPDKRIKYAAAAALVRLVSEENYSNRKAVVDAVSRNLQESQARKVLVISESESLRSAYVSDLKSLNINADSADTLERGMDLATQGPIYDVIILQGDYALSPTFVWEPAAGAGSDREGTKRSDTIINLLTTDVRTSGIPLLIATSTDDVEDLKRKLSGFGMTDDNFITHTAEGETDPTALKDILDPSGLDEEDTGLWSGTWGSSKARSNEGVIDISEAIASIDARDTKFNVKAMLEALVGGLRLDGRSSDAREAICHGIENLISDSKRMNAEWVRSNVVPNLIATLVSDQATDSPSVKGAAASALGACYRNHKKSFDEDGYNALRNMLRLGYILNDVQDEGDRERMISAVNAARNEAGKALGLAPTTIAQRLEINRVQQTNPHAAHPESRTGE